MALIGNCTIGVLVNARAPNVVGMFPTVRPGDPTFCSLMRSEREAEDDFGHLTVELENLASSEQHYVRNTAVLCTSLTDTSGGTVEITDFAPRYRQYGRYFAPMMLVRVIRPVSGIPESG